MWVNARDHESVLVVRIQTIDHQEFAFDVERHESTSPGPTSWRAFKTILPETRDNLRECLRRLVNAEGFPDLSGLQALGQLMHDQLLPIELHEEFASQAGAVVISSEDLALPWELVHDGKKYLCLKQPLCRHLQIQNARGRLSSQQAVERNHARALIIANPESGTHFDLPNSVREARMLEQLFHEHGLESTVLLGNDCSWSRVLTELRDPTYSFIHLAGHVRDPEDQTGALPAFYCSDARLAFQEIMSSFRSDAFVFLSTCSGQPLQRKKSTDPAQRQIPSPIGQANSLASAFLSFPNCRGVVGTMWWIADEIAFDVSKAFYEHLLDGVPTGEAMRQARDAIFQNAKDPALWASYIQYGDPHLTFQCTGTLSGSVRPEPSEDLFPADPAIPPLDASGRLCLLNAYQEQRKMLSPAISSVHLLIGMMRIPDGAMSELLERAQIPTSLLADALCEALRRKDPPKEKWKGRTIRGGLAKILAGAKDAATKEGKSEVGELHILGALLDARSSGAYLLLTLTLRSIGRSASKLAELRQKKPPKVKIFKNTGVLNDKQFSRSAFMVLDQARTEAVKNGWAQIRSPHLAVAVLSHPDSDVSVHARQNGVKAEQIVACLRKEFVPTEHTDEKMGELDKHVFSENALKCLKYSARIAQARGSSIIDERDIWRAVLMDPSDFFVKLLLTNDVWPLRLLPYGW